MFACADVGESCEPSVLQDGLIVPPVIQPEYDANQPWSWLVMAGFPKTTQFSVTR